MRELKQGVKAILVNCLKASQQLKEFDTEELISLAEKLSSSVSDLYDVLEDINDNRSPRDSVIDIKLTNEKYCIDNNLCFNRREIIEFFAIVIDCYQEILPLGTVVDLKKEHFKDQLPTDRIKAIRLVITHRFLHNPEEECYFPYAGVIYPIGSVGNDRIIHFTSPFIEKVVQKGFTDEKDEAYILLMKHELLCKRKLTSYSFASMDINQSSKVEYEQNSN